MYHREINPEDYYVSNSKKVQVEEVKDYTDKFLKVLEDRAGKKGFSGIIWTTGQTGSGKTFSGLILQNLFLTYAYHRRNCAFYQAPPDLLIAVQEAVPAYIRKKFRIINKLSEVQEFDVVLIDEGYLSADAKEALTRDSRNFIASLTTLRHKSVFFILNSLDDGILRGYRKKAQFQFYKRLPHGLILETRDKFAKKYEDIITKLDYDQTLFRTTHPSFANPILEINQGILTLHIDDYCPWIRNNEEAISRSFEGLNFDAHLRKINEKKQRMEKIIKMITDKFNEELLKTKATQKVQGFLFDEHIKLFNEFERDIPMIVKVAIYRLSETLKLEEQTISQEHAIKKEIIIPGLTQRNDENACAAFFKTFYENNDDSNEFPTYIYHIIKNSMGLREATTYFDPITGIKYNRLQRLLHQYQNGDDLPNPALRLGFVYEEYIAQATGGMRAGGIGEPDILYHDDDGNVIGIGECKFFIIHGRSSQQFFIDTPRKHAGKLNSGSSYCKEFGLKKFVLFCRIVPWINADFCVPVSLKGLDPFKISKQTMEEPIQNFMNFNYKEFFKENTDR